LAYLQSTRSVWFHHGSKVSGQLSNAGTNVAGAHANDHAFGPAIALSRLSWGVIVADMSPLLLPNFRHVLGYKVMDKEVL
jgi:hypothetical protein